MNRPMLAALLLAASIVLIALTVRPNSDASAIFGPGGAELGSLDTPAGRELIIALENEDVRKRNAVARDISAILADDPLVAMVRSGPIAPSQPFLNWLWINRFQLAPPDLSAFESAVMAKRLGEARALMASAEGFVVTDRLLRDPTGSYATIIKRIAAASSRLPRRDGIWQSKDDTAALIFVTLNDRPFDAAETAVLADNIRTIAAEHGVTPHLVGLRIISAEISAATASASTIAASLATGLLIVWLAWSLRSLTALALVILPLALAFAAATLAVQFVFGSVHIIALGFGGALTGLALDYPLHLLGHVRSERGNAARLVLIGAVTTGIGFIAMLGSGIPVLMQTGVFIASGLVVAALAARLLLSDASVAAHSLPLEMLSWALPFKRAVEILLIIAGLITILATSGSQPKALFDPPAHVTASIELVRQMVDLPSGRYAIEVRGESLEDLLARQHDLLPRLDAAVETGALESYTMLAQVLGGDSTDLPKPEIFATRAELALRQSGMAPDFVEAQEAAYREALAAPAITPADLENFSETRPLAARLQASKSGWREHIRLTGVTDPKAIATAIASTDVKLLDLVAPVTNGLSALRRQVVFWLGIGAFSAFVCLTIGLRNRGRAVDIALTSTAALGLTIIVLTSVSGPPGIFQIIALTLVVGIGIDYGLFLHGAESPERWISACRSVALCAGSTLIAFTVMALSPVKLLHEIGLTVSLGVLAMLLLNLAHTPSNET